MRIREIDKIYVSDLNLTQPEQDDLVGRALAAITKWRSRRIRHPRDEALIGYVLYSLREGWDEFDPGDQTALDDLEDRLGYVPVWLNPDEVFVRVRDRSSRRPREDAEIIRVAIPEP